MGEMEQAEGSPPPQARQLGRRLARVADPQLPEADPALSPGNTRAPGCACFWVFIQHRPVLTQSPQGFKGSLRDAPCKARGPPGGQ